MHSFWEGVNKEGVTAARATTEVTPRLAEPSAGSSRSQISNEIPTNVCSSRRREELVYSSRSFLQFIAQNGSKGPIRRRNGSSGEVSPEFFLGMLRKERPSNEGWKSIERPRSPCTASGAGPHLGRKRRPGKPSDSPTQSAKLGLLRASFILRSSQRIGSVVTHSPGIKLGRGLRWSAKLPEETRRRKKI